MPLRTPRPKTKLTDQARLSVAIMERVGAMLRKSPPTDMKFACLVMKEERDAFDDEENPRYAQERAQAGRDGAVRYILASIAAKSAERILDHEDKIRKAAADAKLVDNLMAPIDAGAAFPVQNDPKPPTNETPCNA